MASLTVTVRYGADLIHWQVEMYCRYTERVYPGQIKQAGDRERRFKAKEQGDTNSITIAYLV